MRAIGEQSLRSLTAALDQEFGQGLLMQRAGSLEQLLVFGGNSQMDPRRLGRRHVASVHTPGASGLQISDSATDVVILRIAGGPPERSSFLVFEGNQGSYSTGAAAAQILLPGPRQRDPDALPPMPFANGEPIHAPSPPIPAGNQSTDDLTTALGDQKGGRGVGDQALDVI